jgi:hypothetical protein
MTEHHLEKSRRIVGRQRQLSLQGGAAKGPGCLSTTAP